MDLEERRDRAHRALLDRFLGYIVGALAGFLPLLDFTLRAVTLHALPLPLPVSVLFVFVGSTVSVLLPGAALVAFLQALSLERSLRIEPMQLDSSLVRVSSLTRLVNWTYRRALRGNGMVARVLGDIAWLLVCLLVAWMDWSLPWPGVSERLSAVVFWGILGVFLIGVIAFTAYECRRAAPRHGLIERWYGK